MQTKYLNFIAASDEQKLT